MACQLLARVGTGMSVSRKDYAPTRSGIVGMVVLLCVACFRGPIFGSAPPITTVSVFIAPRPGLGPMRVGDTVSVVAEASAANGDFLVPPAEVIWISSRPDVVQLDPTAVRDQHIARGISAGATIISVVMSGVTGQVTLTIAP